MSDQAMKDAQLAQAIQENAQLKSGSRNMSAQIASQKQCIEEYMNANIYLRSLTMLFEDDIKTLKHSLSQHAERIAVLEAENAELKSALELAVGNAAA